MAVDFTLAAERAEETQRRRTQTRHRLQAVNMLATYIGSALSADAAVRAVASMTGWQAGEIEKLLPCVGPHLVRAKRNRRIMQMVAAGHTDAEIGARFGLHQKSVNRIVKEERRKAA